VLPLVVVVVIVSVIQNVAEKPDHWPF